MLIQDQVSIQVTSSSRFFPKSTLGWISYFRYKIFCLKSAILRNLRRANERYNYLLLKGKLDIGNFVYDETLQKRRGKDVAGVMDIN